MKLIPERQQIMKDRSQRDLGDVLASGGEPHMVPGRVCFGCIFDVGLTCVLLFGAVLQHGFGLDVV